MCVELCVVILQQPGVTFRLFNEGKLSTVVRNAAVLWSPDQQPPLFGHVENSVTCETTLG